MAAAKESTKGQAINGLEPGQFTTIEKINPCGALQARKLSNGAVKLYWRFTFAGKTERVEIGLYDSTLPPKSLAPRGGRWSIAAASSEASKLAQAHHEAKEQGGHAGLQRAEAEAQASARAAQAAAQAQADAEAARRSKYTLTELLKAYWSNLEALGRPSHRQARTALTNHVICAWPEVAQQPAAEVTDEQIADMLRRLFDLGKGRTANILRAYLRAAYETARKAKTDPKIPVGFKAFGITRNPAADTAANSDANKAAKHPLSTEELRTYWQCIKDLRGLKGAALKLHLLTGGQRIEQLVRLKSADITAHTITIFDGKGRPGQPPRVHVLPLIAEAAKAVQMLDLSREYALSTDSAGTEQTTHIANTTLSAWATKAACDSIPGFQAKRVRSGVETLLSSVGISQDTRGRLQSHGISGVQARHYDGHDYMDEKRAALEALFRELSAKRASNVRAIRAG